jgi:hypothetical protein
MERRAEEIAFATLIPSTVHGTEHKCTFWNDYLVGQLYMITARVKILELLLWVERKNQKSSRTKHKIFQVQITKNQLSPYMNCHPMCWTGPPSTSYTTTHRHVTPHTAVFNNSCQIGHNKIVSSSSTIPGPFDVVCARGRQFFNHSGNRRYRDLVGRLTKKYASARNKMEKSLVVLNIIEQVHQANGRFIKRENKDGPWVEANEIFAREKCTQSLRDGLSTKYRSATKAKRERRSQHDKRFHRDIDNIVRSNALVVLHMESLTKRVSVLNSERPAVSDEAMMDLFTQINSKILDTIKSDPSMHLRYQAAAKSANMGAEFVDDDSDLIHAIEDEDMSLWEDVLAQNQRNFIMPPAMIELW